MSPFQRYQWGFMMVWSKAWWCLLKVCPALPPQTPGWRNNHPSSSLPLAQPFPQQGQIYWSVPRQGVHRGSSLQSVGSFMEWGFNKRGPCLHMEPQSQLRSFRSSHSHSMPVILHQCVYFRFNSYTRQGASAATDLCDLLVCLWKCFVHVSQDQS